MPATADGPGPRLRAVNWLVDAVAGVGELVFAGGCAGCAAGGPAALCADCRGYLSGLRPYPTRPTPAPTGLPDCHALGAYDGVLREALLGYKERGRYPLAGPLGALLADVVAAAVPDRSRPLLLVPVPDAPGAARERYGDHLRRLADRAAKQLRAAGWSAAVAPVLAARPKADSAHLDTAGRARAAAGAFTARARPVAALRRAAGAGATGPRATVVLLDDILTTGATLAAVAAVLDAQGVPVASAAVLAATRRRTP